MAKSKNIRKKVQPKEVNLSHYLHLIIGLALTMLGAGLLLYSAFTKIPSLSLPQKPQALAENKQSFSTNKNQELLKPTKIYIPKMDRVLAVSDGFLIEDRWIVSETGVSYYTDSAIPGTGNSVLYGHNTKGILGGLWRLDEGDFVYVILKNGHFVKYQVSEEKEIKPTQVEILKKTPESRLTLYTCSGFLDTARFVVTANQVQSVI